MTRLGEAKLYPIETSRPMEAKLYPIETTRPMEAKLYPMEPKPIDMSSRVEGIIKEDDAPKMP